MHKALALLTFCFLTHFAVSAQTSDNPTPPKKVEKPSRDFLMFQLTYDGWAGMPDSIKMKGFNRGFNAYLCYDFPISKSHFSFAAGIGIGTSNVYLNGQRMSLTDTGAVASQVRFLAEEPGKDYSKYKFTTAHLEAPFELRYFGNKDNRNKGFKAAIGMRVGTLMAGHTKGVYKVPGAGNKVIEKELTKRYLEPWRVGATLRLGYGNFTVMGAYQLNGLFRDGQGPAVTPYSIGIAITGL